ncbi:uncharacterized protein K444DRAFT_612901 [Hyaloscypha bicolor E]|uniref:Methyltransferase domain-containing protein n=1 Tax=Hyaloscypha bicolor E TaxID=1095630 RepID=A0A2J6T9Z9_9HELO|nr:uncharacterized protein K444DRAFT_612901 [Hyaloscypha bicolor E]PMD59828.1 hypothetical protein K444DRAFT_612901 [Hyaloscypha bicolor E]
MLMLCNGGLHFAPIRENPQNIVDLGTGTGIWALDIADKYPSALVVGVNLSPIRRQRHKVSGIQGIRKLSGSPAYRSR